MISAILWHNLLAYSAQVLALVAAGALLPFLFRVRQPRAQLITCQLLLVASLVLPALQPWRRPLIVVPEEPATAVAPITTPLPATQPAPPRIRFENAVLWVLAAGVAMRVLWLLVGLWRLHRYRLGATPLYPLPAAIESARAQTGADAVICVSAAVDSPVTFGFLPPVILLPPALLEQPFEEQFAVASHEFLHVRRHDWLFTIGEELAGALVWFHPAVWWLQSQIRLAREQVVDRQVVALTEARDPYVSALLAMSGARLRLDLAPAPLFLRKRHLAQRIHSLLKEVSVSKRRLISSYASIAAILVLTAWLVAASFPLSGSPQVEVQQRAVVDPPGISVQPGGTLLHRTPVRYPAEAVKNKIEGVIVAALTLNADGTVSDVRILSGPDELRRTVLESVLQWHYLREASGVVQATVEFRLPEAPPPPPPPPPPPAGVITPVPAPPQQSLPVLESIDPSNLPEPLQGMLRDKLAPFKGQPLSIELFSRIRETISQVDSHVNFAPRLNPETRSISLVLTLNDGASPQSVPTRTAQTNFPPTPGVQRIRMGGAVQAPKLISQPKPVYPTLARQARISGVVRFDALIGADGHVATLALVNGHPLLVPVAQEAVQGWVYRPTLLNGQPVEVVTEIDVNFTLQ